MSKLVHSKLVRILRQDKIQVCVYRTIKPVEMDSTSQFKGGHSP